MEKELEMRMGWMGVLFMWLLFMIVACDDDDVVALRASTSCNARSHHRFGGA